MLFKKEYSDGGSTCKDFPKYVPYIVVGFFALGLLLRLSFALQLQLPGTVEDASFYYNLAKNLVEGKGLTLDYIVYYLSPPESIVHPGNVYWMPLAAFIMSIFFLAGGVSLFVAALPGIISGLAISVLTFFWCRKYSASSLIAWTSAILALFIPYLFIFSVLTETVIYFALFGFLCLYCSMEGNKRPAFFLPAAFFAGLAHMTRHDGFIYFVAVATLVFLSPHRRKIRLRVILLSAVVYFVTIAPLLVINFSTFGQLSPPGMHRVLFATSNADLYTYESVLTPETFFGQGCGAILNLKLKAAVYNIKILYDFLRGFLWAFVLFSIAERCLSSDRRKYWRYQFPPFLVLLLLFLFHSLVVSATGERGGFMRSAVSLLPFFVVFAVDAIVRHIPSKPCALMVILLATLPLLNRTHRATQAMIDDSIFYREKLEELSVVIQNRHKEARDKDVVIMTNIPGRVYFATGYHAIQTPLDKDLDIIYTVAQRYGANYLFIRPADLREPLYGIYYGTNPDVRFQYVTTLPDSGLKLFSIAP